MIVVQSTFQLLPDSKQEALKLMRNMVRLCRLEHGCLSYEYFEGVTDPNQVVLAYCRTGTRCANLWVATREEGDLPGAVQTARDIGFDLSMVVSR